MRRRLLVAAPLLLGGCSTVQEWGYRAQAVGGHLDLLSRAEPIERWLADPATPEPLKERLRLAQQLRRFASQQLALPDNGSYSRYAELNTELQADAVVWNVVAAPVHGFQLKRWCFPLMGCVAYRGYWQAAEAEQLATQLQQQGWDVYRYGVPAYSTLGWSNALGGDPLLCSFLRWGEAELARLLFHELAHQQAYAVDDSAFNESYATAVERLGLAAWWQARPNPSAEAEDAARQQRRTRWRQLALAAKADLQQAYAAGDGARAKPARFARLQAELAALRQQDAGYAGYEAWARQANNAHLALLSTYESRVPAFEALFHSLGRHWPAFHAEVARQARLPAAQRTL